MRRVTSITLIWFLFVLLAGCSVSQRDSPVATPLPKQPEPRVPRIGGQITGISDDELATFHIRATSGEWTGWESHWGTRRGNGLWEAVVTGASGNDYVLTAEAEGYVSQPLTYTLHISGTIVTVDNPAGEPWIGEEVMTLDFQFTPVSK